MSYLNMEVIVKIAVFYLIIDVNIATDKNIF